MKRKTVLLALLDSIPVLSYGITMLLIALRFPSPLFMVGAAVSVLAGVFKLASKIAGATHNLRWLKRPFVPMQITGFVLILFSLILEFKKLDWYGALSSWIELPGIIFIFLGLIMCRIRLWRIKHNKEDNTAKSRWIDAVCDAVCWTSLMLSVLFAH